MIIKKITFLFLLLLAASGTASSQGRLTYNTFGSIEARQIGPAVMSGRITAIDAVNSDPRIFYVGSAGGGLWKTITGGTMFKPVFDKYTMSIGAVTIDQSNPNIVWVGTGESNMRNSVSVGTGLYKTEDAGDSWQKAGLDSTEHISKIVVNPKNGSIVYAAAPGPLWSDSPNRGLYKTIDGGRSWEKILYVDDKTGCADIIIDPNNPDVIYASMWQFRRKPWSFSSGGPGSGLFKSMDGGRTWNRIDGAFAEGDKGRICLALAPSDPSNIYAIVEAKKTALYKSTDYGSTWKKQSGAGNVTARPFYFSVITVDPLDSKRIYRPAFNLSYSNDGGESFTEASTEGGWVHSDLHALWINPKNTSHLLLGTDGGVYVSFDKGNNWMFLRNLPVSQFYHVTTDHQKPYWVYGGLQDNGSWMGPSESPSGIKNKDWISVGFGDGFWVHPDLTDKNTVFWESQGGSMARTYVSRGEGKDIQPYQGLKDPKLRYNWNAPLVSSPSDPSVFYAGSQFLYRTNNKGDTWTKISPDLTTNDPNKQKQEESGGLSIDNSAAENHCTIYTIGESPIDNELIWVGTDDGNVQVTGNGGGSWKNKVKNISGLPATTWCSSVEPSRFDRNTCFVTFDGHRYGDWKTYVYKTTNLGNTWVPLNTSSINGWANRIKEDAVDRNLLFLGTEFGLYISPDAGKSWSQFKGNCPNVSIMDIAVQPDRGDLVLATHGRGVLIVDDLTTIRSLDSKILNSEAYILPNRVKYLRSSGWAGYPNNSGDFVGPNPPDEAVINYYLRERAVIGDIRLEIYNSEGKLVKTLPASIRKGINTVKWDMAMPPPKVATGSRVDFSGFNSPYVPAGNYTIKLIKNDKVFTGTLKLVEDPDSPNSEEDRALQRENVMRLYKMQEELAYLVTAIKNVHDSVLVKASGLSESDASKKKLTTYADSLESFRKTLVATKEGTGIIQEEQMREKISSLYNSLLFYPGRPTDSQIQRGQRLSTEMKEANITADMMFTRELAKINGELKSKNLGTIKPLTREEFFGKK
jgi:photosystem II stability/assembly factor-like uncharacterized protein